MGRSKGKEIPPQMLDDLYQAFTNNHLTSLTQKADSVNRVVHELLKSGSSYQRVILNNGKWWQRKRFAIREEEIPDTFITAKTIGLVENRTPVAIKTLFILAAYCGYTLAEAKQAIRGKDSSEIPYSKHLAGAWHVYFHDSSKDAQDHMMRGLLWLHPAKRKAYAFKASFMVKWSDEPFEGIGRIENQTLVLEFNRDYPFFYVCAKLPEKAGRKPDGQWLLNAGAVSTGLELPVMANVILLKNIKITDEDELFSKPIKSVFYQELDNTPEHATTNQRLVNEAIIYLSRHQDRPVFPFLPDTVTELAERNALALKSETRHNYTTLKRKLYEPKSDKTWYSFSRVISDENRIAIFQWGFSFNDAEQTVNVKRWRIDRPDYGEYEGEVTLKNDHLYIHMRDIDRTKRKSIIAPLPKQEEVDNLYGISSTTFPTGNSMDSNNMAIRELLFQIPKDQFKEYDLTKGHLTYEEFVNFKGITDEQKLYLSNRKYSTLSFPHPQNPQKHYYRLNKARQFHGEYFLILRNDYITAKSLFLMTITIDRLSNVVLTIKLSDKIPQSKYLGTVEYYANNLHMHLEIDTPENRKQKIANLIFDSVAVDSEEAPDFFTGISITTDRELEAEAYRFVMIRKHIFRNKYPFEPSLIDIENTPPIELNIILQEHLHKTVDEFFYQHALV
ncbi:hypothetical protein [Aquimarina aggregata]|uniref:hypothetical protein n=1 Tax=Aquimarina aggregata TaxID=1642818 RepID=UPI002490F24E|nr:hypothetical protein [Aquimarina aggregata]